MSLTDPRASSALDALAVRHLQRFCELNPSEATYFGIAGHDRELTDYSPEANAARAELARATLAEAGRLADQDHRDEIARSVMTERLELNLEREAAGEPLRALSPIGSPVQEMVIIFTLMATETDADWDVIAERMEQVPNALSQFTDSLRVGLSSGTVAARRQALVCATQARTRAGGGGSQPFHASLVGRYAGGDEALRNRLEAAAAGAASAYGALAVFLEREYAPRASEADGVGRERYGLGARYYTGASLDLDETYAWGIAELGRLREEMAEVAGRILPGASLPEVFAHLDHDLTRSIEGEEAFHAWNQQLVDDTMTALEGTYFDIPEPVQRVEAMIAPPGGAAAMYYTPPSADFSRPGRTWYPTLGRTRFPLWMEPSVAYHEGVPGHHLQVGTITYYGPKLNSFQRWLGHISGYTEGWALYAERLMAELGFLDDPAYYLGMLANNAFRAARVVLDIGLHLGLTIPTGEAHAGERWGVESAVELLMDASGRPEAFCRSEIDRYLGLPGQAISYKVGERVWLETRAAARRRLGGAFDLKAFHAAAFELGFVGLAQLAAELS